MRSAGYAVFRTRTSSETKEILGHLRVRLFTSHVLKIQMYICADCNIMSAKGPIYSHS